MHTLTSRSFLPILFLVPVFVMVVLGMSPDRVCAQDAPHPARGLTLEKIPWIHDGAEFLDKRRFKTSMTAEEDAVDREQLLEVALQRARRAGRPVLCYVYKIVESTKRGRQMIRAPVLDIYMRQLIWSDPDVERIVNASFIPLRTVFDDALCKRFGLRPLTFLEPAVLFLSPKGEVLHSLRTIRTIDAPWFAGVLRDVLQAAHGPFVGDDYTAARRRGEWRRALAIHDSTSENTAAALYERAGLQRRLRRGDDALRSLVAARAALAKEAAERAANKPPSGAATRRTGRRRGPRLPPDLRDLSLRIDAEEGAVHGLMGRFDRMIPPSRRAADAATGERRAEARYRLALHRLRSGDEAGAMRGFQKIVQDDPEDRFGRRATVNLLVGVDDGLSLGAPLFGYERLTWLPDAAYSKLPEDTHWPGAPFSDAELVQNCLEALLSQQRSSGGWNDSRYAYCPDARITPNVWVAITAICCQALLRHREHFSDRERIDSALRRGEAYLLDANRLNRGSNEDVYADAYRLLFLERLWESDEHVGRRNKRIAAMTKIVQDARKRQKSQGFWAHEYSNAFCTAAMVQGLMAAKRVGVPVPDEMLSLARTALLSARASDGSYSYGGSVRRGSKLREGSLRNASTRMPMCEGALHILGASDLERLVFAFDNFWEHYGNIEGVRRTDFHADGQIAGFMFMHALYHTSEVIPQLSEERARRERERMRAKLRTYPEIDGTFMDSQELGRSYGSAMALLILANTEDPGGGE